MSDRFDSPDTVIHSELQPTVERWEDIEARYADRLVNPCLHPTVVIFVVDENAYDLEEKLATSLYYLEQGRVENCKKGEEGTCKSTIPQGALEYSDDLYPATGIFMETIEGAFFRESAEEMGLAQSDLTIDFEMTDRLQKALWKIDEINMRPEKKQRKREETGRAVKRGLYIPIFATTRVVPDLKNAVAAHEDSKTTKKIGILDLREDVETTLGKLHHSTTEKKEFIRKALEILQGIDKVA